MTTEKNVHQRIAAVMEKVSYIQREEKKGMTYRVVSHDKVTALLRPAMMECGVACYPVRCDHTHNGNRAECSMTVRFVNIDAPTDFIDVQSFGYGVDTQDKGPGKAMSYAVKYALLKTFCLETGDDPDNESIQHTKEDPHVPPQVATEAETIDAIDQINAAGTLPDLGKVWTALNTTKHIAAHPFVIAAKDARKAALTEQKAAA